MENNTTNTARPVWDPAEKKLFGKNVDFINWGVLLYYGVILFISMGFQILYMLIAVVIFATKNELTGTPTEIVTDVLDAVMRTDGGMIAAVVCGSAVMIPFMRKRTNPKEIFAKQKKMTLPAFISLLFIFMSFQLPTTLLFSLSEKILNMFGLSAESAMEAATAGGYSFIMMVYVGFFAPFFEEFIFRGFTMKAYNKLGCGKLLPIIMSAVMFGLMHGNPVQICYATTIGLVLGYTAMEYGVIWSILLHFINNFIFGDVTTYLIQDLPDSTQTAINMSIFAVFFVGGIVALIINFRKIIAYIKENTCNVRYFLRAYCSIPLIIFAVICLAQGLLLIQTV